MQRPLALLLALFVLTLCPCLEARVSVPVAPKAAPQRTLRAKVKRGWAKTKAFAKRHERKLVIGAGATVAALTAVTLAIANHQGGTAVPATDVGFILSQAKHLADPAIVKEALVNAPMMLKVSMGAAMGTGAASAALAHGVVKNKREVGKTGFGLMTPRNQIHDLLVEMQRRETQGR